jgi:outer membrane protein assembly factor BamB
MSTNRAKKILISKNTLIATVLIILMATSAVMQISPSANAQTTQYTKVVYPFCGATPNPVGVGQVIILHIGITDQVDWALYNGLGWQGITVTVTKPDNKTETLGPFTADTTGGTGATYIPDTVGTYYFQTNFPETFVKTAQRTIPHANTTLLAATSPKTAVIVQQEPRNFFTDIPLPVDYWSRPIDAQLRQWSTIAGNWLDAPPNLIADYNDAPLTAHTLWAKPLGEGGVIGGDWGTLGQGISPPYDVGQNFEMGDAYEGWWGSSGIGPQIIAGRLYYNQFASATNHYSYDSIICLDLHTGEQLFAINNTKLTFAQILFWGSFNHDGGYAYLWSVSGTTWNAYDAFTGQWVYSYTNVPSGTRYRDISGNILIYTVNLAGGYMTLWNGTKCVNPQNTTSSADGSWGGSGRNVGGKTFDARASGYEWNKTIPKMSGAVAKILGEDRVIGSNLATESPAVANIWAISLAHGQEGTLLYNTTWAVPSDWIQGNKVVEWMAFSSEDEMGTLYDKEGSVNYGVDLTTGKLAWGPSTPQYYLDSFEDTKAGARLIYEGKLYSASCSGIVYCYDVKTGAKLWEFAMQTPYQEIQWANQWWARPLFVSGDKIYVAHYEHSPNSPMPRGAPFVCLNATTGDLIWRTDGMYRSTRWGGRAVIGDSIMATMDTYDLRVYGVGKGPSALTVDAPMAGITAGNSVVIRGTLTDISPGTKDESLTVRFPNGVPAVSDESMSQWMLYVYKQFPIPTNATGLEISIDALDPNSNIVHIGTATTDASGSFSYMWQTPDIEGKYTVYASFAGSNAYYPTSAQTAMGVVAPQATAQPSAQPISANDSNLAYATTGIIVAIAVVGLVLALLIRKRP